MGRPLNPDLYRLEFDGGRPPRVWKTFQYRPAWIRNTIGRFVTRKEFRALRHLRQVEGICRPVGDDCREGLLLEWVPGKPLTGYPLGELAPSVYEQLDRTLKRMHEAGIVHLDLAHRGNILVTPDGKPILLDFQAAMSVRGWPRFLARVLERVDELAILKWKAKLFPALMTPDEKQRIARRNRVTRLWPFHHWFFWFQRRRS